MVNNVNMINMNSTTSTPYSKYSNMNIKVLIHKMKIIIEKWLENKHNLLKPNVYQNDFKKFVTFPKTLQPHFKFLQTWQNI